MDVYSHFMQLYHCDHCHKDLPIESFYIYAKRKCKGCFKAYRQWYEKTFPEKVAAKHKRMWEKHKDRYLIRDRAKKRIYNRDPGYADKAKLWKRTHRIEYNVKGRVEYAVKSGKLIRPSNCSKCGFEGKIQAHHEDYAKPFDVIWLCASCHRRRHKEMDALGIKPLNGSELNGNIEKEALPSITSSQGEIKT